MNFGTIHLVAGTWASGKSSIAQRLTPLVPEHVVFDWDLIIPGLSLATQSDVHTNPSAWPGLKAIWISILQSVAGTGRDIVLIGPLTAEEFSLGELPTTIRCACLSWPDETIAARLSDRGLSQSEILEELQSASELRSSGHDQIELDGCSIEQMTERVASWIRDA